VGDALGAQFFVPGSDFAALRGGRLPSAPWPWTDDTEMACSIVAELAEHGGVDQDRLAARFAERFEPYRGYGGGAVVLLRQIRQGMAWREAAAAILGAVAVAVAAAEAGWARVTRQRLEPAELVDLVLAYLIDGRGMTGIVRARRLLGVSVAEAAYELGNGSQVLAFDTVPFAL
jgi:ADP-ribosylglycohydrolase